MGIKGSVTINIASDGTVTLVPPLGKLDRNIQWMQWTLAAPANYKFAAVPIVFQTTDLPPGFIPWSPPGDPPQRESDWQVRAKANLRVDHGQPAVFYRYDIDVDVTITDENGGTRVEHRRLSALHPATLERIDPDMENEPQP